MTATAQDLPAILADHAKWLNGEDGGNRADLSRADLSGADLSRADLSGADLSRADLSRADLSGADLSGAYLSDTALDARRRPADATDRLRSAGIPIHDGIAYGWRTRRSRHIGETVYAPGRYVAPVFSACGATDCHPGIYFASRGWLTSNYEYAGWDLVPCATWVSVVCAAGDKFRTRELWVFDEADERWEAA